MPPAASNTTTKNKGLYETPRALLLLPYAIVPLLMAVVLVDQLFLGGAVQAHAPTQTSTLVLLFIFLNMPHITASSITFLDAEYLRHYGARIAVPAALLALTLLAFPTLVNTGVYLMAYVFWNVLHLVGQSIGQCRLLGAGFEKTNFLWKVVAVLITVPLHFAVIGFYFKDTALQHYVTMGILALLVPFLVFAYLAYKPVKTQIGRLFIGANVMTAVFSIILYFLHYPSFCILIGRIVHDVSAFIFYISHDMNRNKVSAKNMLYRFLSFSSIPVYILCPVLASVLIFPVSYLSYLKGQVWAMDILAFLSLMHFYTEGFAWKRDGLQRQYIRMR